MTGFNPPSRPAPIITKRSERGMRPILPPAVGGARDDSAAAAAPPASRSQSSWIERKAERSAAPKLTDGERKERREAALKLHGDINPARIDDDGSMWPYCYQDTSRLVLCCECEHFADDSCASRKPCSLQVVPERAEVRRWLVPIPGHGRGCFAQADWRSRDGGGSI